ncbi:hypothetical protein P4C99_10480 [Pontiellaceae bacterium B1224]|nr:hypothetical protein [Pontiellaceae bacterium B1224]
MKTLTRKEMLKGTIRGGALAGLVGFGFVLTTREEKFECSTRCGKCPKLTNGKCGLGLK